MCLAAQCSGGSLIEAITSLTQNFTVTFEVCVLSYYCVEYRVHIYG